MKPSPCNACSKSISNGNCAEDCPELLRWQEEIELQEVRNDRSIRRGWQEDREVGRREE